jgi:hypothetical protein
MPKSARFALAALVLLTAPACADRGTPVAPEHADVPAARQMLDALSVTISGPTTVPAAGEYEWTANVTGGDGTYSYAWYVLDTSTFTWIYRTDGPSFTDEIGPGRGPERVNIRVVVTSGSESASDTHSFNVWTP